MSHIQDPPGCSASAPKSCQGLPTARSRPRSAHSDRVPHPRIWRPLQDTPFVKSCECGLKRPRNMLENTITVLQWIPAETLFGSKTPPGVGFKDEKATREYVKSTLPRARPGRITGLDCRYFLHRGTIPLSRKSSDAPHSGMKIVCHSVSKHQGNHHRKAIERKRTNVFGE